MFHIHDCGITGPGLDNPGCRQVDSSPRFFVLQLAATLLMLSATTVANAAKGDKGGPPNRAPQIGGTPVSQVRVGDAYDFVPDASDRDGDPLTFVIVNPPTWASFDSTTGRLYGTPQAADIGITSGIEITVSDGQAESSLGPFSIEVVDAASNRAPTISGSPPTDAVVGENYSFVPSASDPDGDNLTFSIENQPGWTTFDSSSGQLSGIPGSADIGSTAPITISVSDGTSASSLPAFSIDVVDQAANQSPQISGTPATVVTVGQNYSFTPAASDPDGDTLIFSIQNKPAWADFAANNGSLTGVPSDADVGVAASVLITVSDGQAETSLTPFDIEVLSAGSATGTASLSWVPPTERRDGSALTNLAGYGIAYGSNSREYDQHITIDNPGITTYLVEGLSDGTWYFSVFAYDADGMTSGFSNEGYKQIGNPKGSGGRRKK